MSGKISNTPLVSIVMNCYNGEEYLKNALNSILNQTYSNWELIFFDNCSTDKSKNIFETYNDSRFKYHKSIKNITLGAARREAVNLCKGEYIGFLDIDDEWFKNKLNIQISQMIEDKSSLSYGGIIEHYESSSKQKIILPKNKGENGFVENLLNFEIQLPTLVIKREKLLTKKLNFDPIIKASEEYCLCMQFIIEEPISVIRTPLAKYLVRKDSLTTKHINLWAFERRYTLNKILEENKYLYKQYEQQFNSAYLRADYYEARFLMENGQYNKARKVLKNGARQNIIYFLLYILFFKQLNFIYKFIIKSKYKR